MDIIPLDDKTPSVLPRLDHVSHLLQVLHELDVQISSIPPPMLSMVDEEPMTKDIEMKSEESRHPNQKLKYRTPRRMREANGKIQEVDSWKAPPEEQTRPKSANGDTTLTIMTKQPTYSEAAQGIGGRVKSRLAINGHPDTTTELESKGSLRHTRKKLFDDDGSDEVGPSLESFPPLSISKQLTRVDVSLAYLQARAYQDDGPPGVEDLGSTDFGFCQEAFAELIQGPTKADLPSEESPQEKDAQSAEEDWNDERDEISPPEHGTGWQTSLGNRDKKAMRRSRHQINHDAG